MAWHFKDEIKKILKQGLCALSSLALLLAPVLKVSCGGKVPCGETTWQGTEKGFCLHSMKNYFLPACIAFS
jgi:hypothetical protein